MTVFTLVLILILTTIAPCCYGDVISVNDSLVPPPLNNTLYREKCCNTSNSGKSFITDTNSNTISVVFCSLSIPESCTVIPPSSVEVYYYSSCTDALSDNAMAKGYYNIDGTDDGIDNGIELYCTVSSICGTSDEVWSRVAYLNMSHWTQPSCPDGFRLYEVDGRRVCGRLNTTMGSCVSTGFFTGGFNYTQICGRVKGYQYGSPDAIDTLHDLGMEIDLIDSHYADCVSITRGQVIRKHVWTYIAGLLEKVDNGTVLAGNWPFCPCIENATEVIPSFVGNDYYCESGLSDFPWVLEPYFTDPLWDGKQCNDNEAICCNGNHTTLMPWFHKELSSPTNDAIELRICCDQGTDNEDVLVEEYEFCLHTCKYNFNIHTVLYCSTVL